MGPIFTCSIDDGHPLDLKTAELLDKHGLHGTFYLPIRNCEGFHVMSPAQIKDISRRFEIGSHTYDHRYLKNIDVRQAYYQVSEGKKRLEDLLGHEVSGFCYPGGRYRRRDMELVRCCGFRYARTTMNLCFDVGIQPYEIPTTVQFYPHDRSVYVRNFIGSGHWLRRQTGLRLSLLHQDWIERLYALFDYACERRATFHLWTHSFQIEQLNAWPAFDALLAHISRHVDVRNRVTNAELVARAFATAVESPVW